MSDTAQSASVFEDLESLPDQKLAMLVQSAMSTLEWEAGKCLEGDSHKSAKAAESVADLPPIALQKELRSEFAARGLDQASADRVLAEPALSRPVALLILKQIGEVPELRGKVEEAYRERTRLLVIDGGLIAGAALLLLVIKLRKIKIGKQGVEVDFEKASDASVNSVLGFVSGVAPM